jgi:hypothetical protein
MMTSRPWRALAGSRPWVLAALLAGTTGLALAQGATQSSAVDLPPSQLKPGQFIWTPAAVPAGPLVMVISLDEQLAYVYRNGLRIGVSTVSSGKKGKETPTGVFTILQKKKVHRSNLYNDAPMPFMQRLTWDGIALHAGNLPGYPASHGCVRLPYEFARRLFDVTTFNMTVVVAQEASAHAEHAHPGLFAPAANVAGLADEAVPRLNWFQAYQWFPSKSPSGPLTVLVSTAEQRVLVIRDGIEIGRAAISVAAGEARIGTQAYVLLAGDTGQPSQVAPGRSGRLGQSIPLPGYAARADNTIDPDVLSRVRAPPEFAALVYDQLAPGATLVLTDAPILPKTTGKPMTVITAEAAPAGDAAPASDAGPARDAAPELPPLDTLPIDAAKTPGG